MLILVFKDITVLCTEHSLITMQVPVKIRVKHPYEKIKLVGAILLWLPWQRNTIYEGFSSCSMLELIGNKNSSYAGSS